MEPETNDRIAGLRAHLTPVEPEDTMAEAGRKVLLKDFVIMLSHESGSRTGEDIEHVHDMRVATRRMRSAFRLLEPYYKSKPVLPHLKQLKTLAGYLGAVRDLDVMIDNLEKYGETLDEAGQDSIGQINKALDKRRRKSRKKLVSYLDSSAYTRFVDQFAAFLTRPGKGSRSISNNGAVPHQVRHVLPALIHDHLATVRAYDTVLADAPAETLHALRIEFKRLRYAISYFIDVLGTSGGGFITDLKAIQDHLGELNDAYVAAEAMRALIDDGRLNKTQKALVNDYIEHLTARETELVDTFGPVWARFNTRTVQSKLSNALLTLR